MARAFQTGVYSMQEIADYFGVHYSTVSRAVRRMETGQDSRRACLPNREMLDCKT
jgi:transposase